LLLDKKQIEDNKIFSKTYDDFLNKVDSTNESLVKECITKLVDKYAGVSQSYEEHLKSDKIDKNEENLKRLIIKHQIEQLFKESMDILEKNREFVNHLE